jgi:hypothetical protein
MFELCSQSTYNMMEIMVVIEQMTTDLELITLHN